MSDKRRNNISPRSTSSRFRLKHQKSSKSEEEEKNNAEVTPNRHSTPIRKAHVTDNMEDSPEMDYRCSPIMGLPCTQQNEVMWSWHSPKGEAKPNEEIRTPKRSAQLQKRRIADSPLMYAPLKVKLRKEEKDIDLFLANFEPFNNQMLIQEVPVPSTSGNYQAEVQSRSNSEKNLETSDEGDMRLVYPDETAVENVSDKQGCTNLKDLLDDEIDESLERCSQQVEQELLPRLTSSISTESKGKQGERDKNQVKKMLGLQNLIKVPFEKPKETKVTVKPAIEEEIIIPDDSIDEYMSQFADDDFNISFQDKKNSGSKFEDSNRRQNSTSKKSLFSDKSTTNKLESAKSCNLLDAKKSMSDNVRLLQKTKSFDLKPEVCRFLSTNFSKHSVQKNENKSETLSSPGKFFKSKSHSEPFSKDSKVSHVQNKNSAPETNSSNSNTQNVRKVIGKSFTCKIFPDSSSIRGTGSDNNKINGSSQESLISNGNKFDNVQLSNINRSVEGLQDKRTNDSQATFRTAEEIERKRIEAKMKLEAKRKMQLSSRVQNTTKILPIAQSIKR